MKKVSREFLNEISKEMFGVSSYWKSFAKKNDLTEEEAATALSKMYDNKPAFDSHISKLNDFVENDMNKVYVNVMGILGFTETRLIDGLLQKTINYEAEGLEVKSEPLDKKNKHIWQKVSDYIKNMEKSKIN